MVRAQEGLGIKSSRAGNSDHHGHGNTIVVEIFMVVVAVVVVVVVVVVVSSTGGSSTVAAVISVGMVISRINNNRHDRHKNIYHE